MSDPMRPPPGSRVVPGGAPVPTGGVFSQSEVLPIIRAARDEMLERRQSWLRLREERDHAKALARKTRADLIVRLRVFGNEGTMDMPIKTSAERNEWADADADVQAAELASDLAQSVQMAAYEAYQDAQAYFATLQGMLGIERDDIRATRRGE